MKQINCINTTEEFNQEVIENKNVLRAIRLKCYDCSAYQLSEVRNCTIETCPLHPFRLGKNPFKKRELSDEERQKIGERLNKNKQIL